jgi:hypothetical protein
MNSKLEEIKSKYGNGGQNPNTAETLAEVLSIRNIRITNPYIMEDVNKNIKCFEESNKTAEDCLTFVRNKAIIVKKYHNGDYYNPFNRIDDEDGGLSEQYSKEMARD